MSILTPYDLGIYMGKTFTHAQEDAAQSILASLEAELEYHLNRPLGFRVFTEEEHKLVPNQRQIFLRNAPVRSVTSFFVGLAGREVEQNIIDFDVYPWGIDNIRIAGTGNQALVTYTAGMGDISTVALERVLYSAATREMGKYLIDAQGLSKLKVEGTEYTFPDNGEGGFTDSEINSVKRFRRRVIF
jgi:hypothetical protein